MFSPTPDSILLACALICFALATFNKTVAGRFNPTHLTAAGLFFYVFVEFWV